MIERKERAMFCESLSKVGCNSGGDSPAAGPRRPFLALDHRALAAAILCAKSLSLAIYDTASEAGFAALVGIDPAHGIWSYGFQGRASPRGALWLARFEPITIDTEGQGQS